MAVQVTDVGAALASRALHLVKALPGASVGLRVDGVGQQVHTARAHLMIGKQELSAQVVDHG